MLRTAANTYAATGTLAMNYGGTGNDTWADLDIPYVSGSAMTGLGIGTNDQLLAVNGTGNGYTWVDAGTVGVDTKLSAEEVYDLMPSIASIGFSPAASMMVGAISMMWAY